MGGTTPCHNWSLNWGGRKCCEYHSRHMDRDKLVREKRDGWDERSHSRHSQHCHRQRTSHILSHSESKNRTEPIHGGTHSNGNGNEAPTTTSGRKTDHHCYKQLGSPAGSKATKASIRANQHWRDLRSSSHAEKRWQFYFHGMGPIWRELRTKSSTFSAAIKAVLVQKRSW